MPRVSSHHGLQDPRLQGPVMPMINPVTIATAGNVTYTPDQLLAGMILRDAAGGARTDSLPSALAMVEAVQGAMVGTSFTFDIRNTSGGATAVTLAAGTGGTLNPASTSVAQSNVRPYTLIFTNVTQGAEAYTVYAGGAAAF